jgi:HNH endonuclease
MSFPTAVKEQVLLACGRYCAICHKFCGIKIELHHIVHQSEGGSDTFDNCIPLCFDCHSDMRTYDFKHPKGTKYIESELKLHRDTWYNKVKNSLGITTLPEYLKLDQEAFKTLKRLLPWHGVMIFVREHDFCNSFLLDEVHMLYNFIRYCKNPEFEFIDADLEGLKSNLLSSVVTLTNEIREKTIRINKGRRYAVDASLQESDKKLFDLYIATLNEAADIVSQEYDNLIRLSRRKLGVSD